MTFIAALLAVVVAQAPAGDGQAHGPANESDDVVFAAGVQALADERPNDAIGAFEILADRGRIDPVLSYDRGLAYAARVRAGAESPGDLGKAAHGFEEAIALSDDAALTSDATHALEQIRTEVGRRRAREGTAVELDTRRPLWRSLSHSLPENAWSAIAIAAAVLLAIALAVRWRSSAGEQLLRARAAANVGIGALVPALVLSAALSATARSDRLNLREAIVVAPSARLADDRGIALAGSSPLPEGARVELVGPPGSLAALAEVRAGGTQAFLPSSALRPIATRHDAEGGAH